MVTKNGESVNVSSTGKEGTGTVTVYAKIFVGFILTASALVAVVWGFLLFVDSRVETKLRDPKVLQYLASTMRPVIYIDDTGKIIYDVGAYKHLEKIEAKPPDPLPCNEPLEGWPPIGPETPFGILMNFLDERVRGIIEITPKEYLNVFPILDPISPGVRVLATERGEGSTLIYHLFYDRPKCEGETFQFRLELTR